MVRLETDNIYEFKITIMYQTNQQAWDEVMRTIRECERREELCMELFGQVNLIGLTNEQRDLFWRSI